MSYFDTVCDCCGREVRGITWVNGMKFCAKCYQETFGNKTVFTNETGKIVYDDILEKYRKIISDLEAKLADKEKELGVKEISRVWWKERANIYCDLIVSLNNILPNKQQEEITFAKVIEDVKSLIAEKEKEIEELKAQRHIYLNRSVEECNKITDLEFELQHKSQDKISFTVEQLIETKEFADKQFNLDICNLALARVLDKIDNQINKLKEIKENK